jgi:hypothetical protein
MYCLIQFYIQLRFDLAHHRPFLKVLAIKLVIFLSFWQSFLVSILTSSTLQIVNANSKIAYPDLKVGIPSLLLCIEMAIFAVLHLFAFPYSPYTKGAPPAKFPISTPSINSGLDGPGPNQGGFLGIKAFVDAMNPWDLVKGFGRGMKWLFVGRKSRENDSSYKNSDFGFGENENGMTLDETGTYKSNSAYKGAVGLPIADEFRRSKFGMPPLATHDEEGAGLIEHAQPNPLNHGDPNYAHPGQAYDYNEPQTKTPYPEDSNPYDYSGQDIGARGRGYDAPYRNNTGYSPSRGNTPGRSIRGGEMVYNQVPHSRNSTPERGQAPYRPEYQTADIGMAVSGEIDPYRRGVPSSQAYGEPNRPRQQTPSEQWKNSSRPTGPPVDEDELFIGGQQRRPNVI